MNQKAGRAIKNSFGEVIEVDTDADQLAWGEGWPLNVTKPLLHGKKFNMGTDHPLDKIFLQKTTELLFLLWVFRTQF